MFVYDLVIFDLYVQGGSIKWKLRTALAVAIPTILITLGLFMYFRCLCKGKLTRKGAYCSRFNFCYLLVDVIYNYVLYREGIYRSRYNAL